MQGDSSSNDAEEYEDGGGAMDEDGDGYEDKDKDEDNNDEKNEFSALLPVRFNSLY